MMLYTRLRDADGAYVGADGERYIVTRVRRVRSPQGVNVDYTPFPSLEAALEVWGLHVAPLE